MTYEYNDISQRNTLFTNLLQMIAQQTLIHTYINIVLKLHSVTV